MAEQFMPSEHGEHEIALPPLASPLSPPPPPLAPLALPPPPPSVAAGPSS